MKLRLCYKLTSDGDPLTLLTWAETPTLQYLSQVGNQQYEWVDVEEVYEELAKAPEPMEEER